jgi:hypothetical protein
MVGVAVDSELGEMGEVLVTQIGRVMLGIDGEEGVVVILAEDSGFYMGPINNAMLNMRRGAGDGGPAPPPRVGEQTSIGKQIDIIEQGEGSKKDEGYSVGEGIQFRGARCSWW